MTAPIVSSVIDAITVYRNGAVVRRVAQVEHDGPIRLTPLPLAMADGSVRIGGDGSVLARDLRVALALTPADPSLPPPDDEELEAALAAEYAASAALDAMREVMSRVKGLRIDSRPGDVEHPPGASPDAARAALLAFQREELSRRREREHALVLELRKARERRKDLQERLRVASNARNPRAHQLRKAVDVTLETGSSGQLSLEYFVPGARWVPSYVLRLDPGMSAGTLEMRARVVQRTGEDWTDARLTLSTADSLSWMELPELIPIRIGRRQPPPAPSGWRPAPEGTERLYRDYATFTALVSNRAGNESEPRKRSRTSGAVGGAHPTTPGAVATPPMPPMGAPAPPSAPMPPPALPSAPMPMQARSAPMPKSPKPAASMARGGQMMKRKSSSVTFAGGGGSGGEMEDEFYEGAADGETSRGDESDEGELIVGRELLTYQALRMPAAHEANRGRLVRASTSAMYREALPSAPGDLAGSVSGAAKTARAVASPPEDCTLPTEVGGYDYAYDAEHRVDIPSQWTWVTVPVASHSVTGTTRFVVVPRESSDAFRSFEVANPLNAPLLRGPLDVYVDGQFLLVSEVSQVDPKDLVRVGLGVDSRLSVARNVRFEERTAGLMRGSLELVHDVEVELRSQLDQAVEVEVRERVPHVSRASKDDIEVAEDNVSPPWSTWDPKELDLQGGRRWMLTLDPRGQRTLRATYVIRISGREELVGGNRRES